jgi:PilZ domain-containing protein
MTETFLPIVSNAEKRRTTRVAKRIPITVTGIDALDQLFTSTTETISVSCHGCKYTSKHYVPKHTIVTVEISCPGLPQSIVSGRIVWVRRPRTVHQEFEIGVEFERPQNVWGIASPPEDWLPFCKKQTAAVDSADETAPPALTRPVSFESSGLPPTPESSVRHIETEIYAITSLQSESPNDQLEATIEKAVEKSIARIANSVIRKVLRQLPDDLAGVIAGKVRREIADKIDIEVKRIVRAKASKKSIKTRNSRTRGQ